MSTILRPMTTGEVLDRTFSLYRHNFALFFGIAMVPPALVLIAQLVMASLGPLGRGTMGANSFAAPVGFGIGMLVFLIAWFIGIAIAHAATVFALSAVHLGRTTTIRESFGRVRGHLRQVLNVVFSVALRCFGVIVLAVLVAIVLIPLAGLSGRGTGLGAIAGILTFVLMIAAMIAGLLLYLRYAVAIQACVLENIKAGAALKRSAFLTKDDRGRIFVIYFLMAVLNYIIAIALVLPATYLGRVLAGPTSMTLLVTNQLASFLAGALTGAIATIAVSLVYYDERVRKEAFDLQLLMNAIDGSPGQAAAANAPAAG